MKKYLILQSHDNDNVQVVDFTFYSVEGAKKDEEKEKDWWEGVEVYEVEEGQEIIVSCKAVEWVSDYNEINYKIKYLVKGDKAIPIEIYDFYMTLTYKETDDWYKKEEADWKKEKYYYKDMTEEKVEKELFGEEAKEEILKMVSEKFMFYLKDSELD